MKSLLFIRFCKGEKRSKNLLYCIYPHYYISTDLMDCIRSSVTVKLAMHCFAVVDLTMAYSQ